MVTLFRTGRIIELSGPQPGTPRYDFDNGVPRAALGPHDHVVTFLKLRAERGKDGVQSVPTCDTIRRFPRSMGWPSTSLRCCCLGPP